MSFDLNTFPIKGVTPMPDNNTTNKKPEPKYYAIIVMDEGCEPEEIPVDESEKVFLQPAQTPEQWYIENDFDFAAGNTLRGIVALSQTEAVSIITNKNSYIPPVDNGEVGE